MHRWRYPRHATLESEANGYNCMPRRQGRRGDLTECSIGVRTTRGAGSVHHVAIDGERSVRVARVEVVQSVKRLNPEFQRLVLAPDMELLEQTEIRVLHAGTIGNGRLLVADPE